MLLDENVELRCEVPPGPNAVHLTAQHRGDLKGQRGVFREVTEGFRIPMLSMVTQPNHHSTVTMVDAQDPHNASTVTHPKYLFTWTRPYSQEPHTAQGNSVKPPF